MKILFKIIINIFFNVILFISKTIAQENTIQILVHNPDIKSDKYLEIYNDKINSYFLLKNQNSSVIPNINLNFSYCIPDPNDGNDLSNFYKKGTEINIDTEYAKNLNCTIKALNSSYYDMVIIDDKFLLGENYLATFAVLKLYFTKIDLYKFFLNYEGYIENDDISFHDDDILKAGRHNNKGLYGIPYEMDFDTLFFNNFNDTFRGFIYKSILNNDTLPSLLPPLNEVPSNFSEADLKNYEGIYQSMVDDGIISAGFGSNDELLNFFVEFIHYKFNIKKLPDRDETPEFFEFLFDEYKSKEFYDSFRKYLIKYTGKYLNKTLINSIEDAYNSFLNNEKLFLRGKASNYLALKSINPNISIHSLPDNTSVIDRKYIVINNNSKKDKKMLVKVALQLSSREMQLYRAKVFGNLPTFDFKRNNLDNYTIEFCNSYPELCDLIKKLNSIDVTTAFIRDKFSGSYIESRLVLPTTLKSDTFNNNYFLFNSTFLNILNIKPFSLLDLYKAVPLFIFQDIMTVIVVDILSITLIMVYFKRKHPYLKAISPFLSSLTIIGMILNISISKFMFFVHTKILCQLLYVVKYFTLNLTNLPMFATIFRIYYIYTNISEVNFGKKLNDKRLFNIISITLSVILIFAFVTVFSDEFYETTMGTAMTTRSIMCFNKHYNHFIVFTIIMLVIMFFVMLVMTIKTIKVSRQYGEVRYVLFILFLLFSSLLYEFIFIILIHESKGTTIFLISHAIYMCSCLCCAYLLVGHRLIYVLKHPIKNNMYQGNDINNDYFNNTLNIIDFIPLKKTGNCPFSFFKKNKNKGKRDVNKEVFSVVKDCEISFDDSITNNPNNYFFNQALKSLSRPKEQSPLDQFKDSYQSTQNYSSLQGSQQYSSLQGSQQYSSFQGSQQQNSSFLNY